jgi:hypothetical protein
MTGARTERPFSLTRGGPLFRVLVRCRLVDPRGRVRWLWLALFAWLPIAVASLVQLAVYGRVDSILRDPTMHVRLLITMPLLVAAEHMLEACCGLAVRHLREQGVVEPADLDPIMDRAERLRDSWLIEAGIALIVLLLGEAALWGIGGWTGFISGRGFEVRGSFATVWCVAIALPLVQFLLLRWLWRWLLWTYVIARLSRLSLSLNAIHPDQAAGLRMLSTPIDAFAIFQAAIASIASVAWMTQIYDRHATVESITPILFTGFAIGVIVACGPLLLFSRQLYRARRRDATAYHALAREYVDEFRRKWIAGRPDAPALGSADIQSLNDLGGSLKTADATRLYPFGVRSLISLSAGAIVPMVPLVFMTTPLSKVAMHFGKMLFGL